ncbi:MAG: efflux RND transporter periplasmic adaptor subunit [Armatimonadetes bacterium]|nr:efflux RND transporter periplasmic adaptor subunit [Armatimonadota bacterium]
MSRFLVRHKWAVLAAIVLILVAVMGVVRAMGRAPEVTVARAHRGDLRLRIAASGLVEADSSDLSFEASGRISALYVAEGDPVARSQLLARISPVGGLPGATLGQDAIQSPFDGTVVEVYLRRGSIVQPGQAVLRVVSAAGGWVTAFIESEDAAYLSPGDRFACRAGGYLSRAWDVTVDQVGREAVVRRDLPGASRQVRVRMLPVQGALPLAPGTEVDIDGEVTLAHDAVLIPAACIVREGPRDLVWTVEGGQAWRRDVQVGPNNFDQIQILEGLREGEAVIVDGKADLREGMRVDAREEPSPAGDRAGGAR